MLLQGGFALDRVQDIVWSQESFNSLVLGATQKSLIHALVKQHEIRASQYDDVVIGKGKGLVGLLAGPPGCGKTLTAEAVAEVWFTTCLTCILPMLTHASCNKGHAAPAVLRLRRRTGHGR